MENQLVSIVTPVYNGEAYIVRFLESVLYQTYPYIELILVDDGSTDKTAETAKDYRIRFEDRKYTLQILSAEHKNASAAINAGLSLVRGEYLIWPDSDDELLPDSVAARVRFLQQNPEYQCVRSIMEYVSETKGEPAKPAERLGDVTKTDLFWDVLEGNSYVCCGCYMLRTEPFFRIYPDRRIPEYDVGQNFQMLLPFLYRYSCPTIVQPLYRVHIRPDSHSRRLLTERQEWEKYQKFEQLLGEIAGICGIACGTAGLRVARWSLRQKRNLARKYAHAGAYIWYTLKTGYVAFRLWFGMKKSRAKR